ncbi:hypothetical protein FB567DRAFT_316592 [Paraphoma chrysanthemicola]|uniref:Uncharacterized protein n=1 Tax=Paraphoma chrysanthemicola TaxID=798071 RepID=A0A8K0R8U0_9PLEO|nr:hypothetical protein FB567DRAFT_316592 [Paraphoma chrysanthemicola]
MFARYEVPCLRVHLPLSRVIDIGLMVSLQPAKYCFPRYHLPLSARRKQSLVVEELSTSWHANLPYPLLPSCYRWSRRRQGQPRGVAFWCCHSILFTATCFETDWGYINCRLYLTRTLAISAVSFPQTHGCCETEHLPHRKSSTRMLGQSLDGACPKA